MFTRREWIRDCALCDMSNPYHDSCDMVYSPRWAAVHAYRCTERRPMGIRRFAESEETEESLNQAKGEQQSEADVSGDVTEVG